MDSRDTGIALTIAGVMVGIAGVVLAYSCTASFLGYCIQYAYRDVGLLGAGFGGVLFVVGLVVFATASGHGAHVSSLPPAPAYGPPPAAPVATCPVCHQPLAWIPQYARWYCSRCSQYR